MYRLVLYDTSNFHDFPIGGQLTSIRNFLSYLTVEHPDFCKQVLLVGITNKKDQVGEITRTLIQNTSFSFLPVLFRGSSLNHIESSLRLSYLKALIANRKLLSSNRSAIHYIHTPEAFLAVKLIHPKARTVVFSHGSFFNMQKGFRFYKNSPFVKCAFNLFLKWLLKSADLLFTLDCTSTEQYLRYNKKIVQVKNSIHLPQPLEENKMLHDPIRLLFVGRLSKVKRVDEIVRSLKVLNDKAVLTIVGDGEEHAALENLVLENQLENIVKFVGAVPPESVGAYMRSHDVLVMNSIFEGQPMTVLEAMSYGMPIITTPVGGICEITSQRENAEYTDGTKESIAEAVNSVKQDFPLYSKNSCAFARSYDYLVVNRNVFDEISKLLTDG